MAGFFIAVATMPIAGRLTSLRFSDVTFAAWKEGNALVDSGLAIRRCRLTIGLQNSIGAE